MAAASTVYFMQQLNELTECAICADTLISPRMLPCMHNFCLECLIQWSKDKNPGDSVSCPVCRTHVKIPPGGYRATPVSFIAQNLVDLQHPLFKRADSDASLSCTNCSVKGANGRPVRSVKVTGDNAGVNGGEKTSVVAFCVECKQNLCVKCADVHKKMKITAGHQIFSFDENKSAEEVSASVADSIRKRKIYCDQHAGKNVSLFCLPCQSLVCSTCMAGQHKGHTTTDLSQAAKKSGKHIRRDVKAISELAADYQKKIRHLQKERVNFSNEISTVKQEVARRTDELQKLIEKNKKQMMQDLDKLEADKLIDFDKLRDGLQMNVAMLETVRRVGTEVLNKGGDADIIRVSDDLHLQAMELYKTPPQSVTPVNVRFKVSEKLQALRRLTANNLIGDIHQVDKIIDPLSMYLSTPVLLSSIPAPVALSGSIIEGIAVLDNEVYTVRDKTAEVQVYDVDRLEARRRFLIPGSQPQDLAICSETRCLYICDWTCYVYRVRALDGQVMSSWKLKEKPGGVSITKASNILITSVYSSQIHEYSPDGVLLRTIGLQPDYDKPWHTVQVIPGTDEQFIFCRWHKLCLINKEGRVTQSYGGRTKGSSQGQLDCPSHLATDKNGFILVADCNNNRIELFNLGQTLQEGGKDLVTREFGLMNPHRIHLDSVAGRLYVGLGDGRLVAYRVLI